MEAIRAALAEPAARRRRGTPSELLARAAGGSSTRPPSLRPVLNATGVIVHTNLGRAPLAGAALERRRRASAGGYANLEFDLDAGAPRVAPRHLGPLLSELTGAEDGAGGQQQRGRGAAGAWPRWPAGGEVLDLAAAS